MARNNKEIRINKKIKVLQDSFLLHRLPDTTPAPQHIQTDHESRLKGEHVDNRCTGINNEISGARQLKGEDWDYGTPAQFPADNESSKTKLP